MVARGGGGGVLSACLKLWEGGGCGRGWLREEVSCVLRLGGGER